MTRIYNDVNNSQPKNYFTKPYLARIDESKTTKVLAGFVGTTEAEVMEKEQEAFEDARANYWRKESKSDKNLRKATSPEDLEKNMQEVRKNYFNR